MYSKSPNRQLSVTNKDPKLSAFDDGFLGWHFWIWTEVLKSATVEGQADSLDVEEAWCAERNQLVNAPTPGNIPSTFCALLFGQIGEVGIV